MAALVWSAVLLAVYTARSASTVSTVVGVVAAVTPFVALLLGSVGLPRMPPRVIRTIVGGVLAADAVLTVGWGGLALCQANRDIDLRAAAHPSGATDVRDGGPHAAIDLVITEHRDRLRVTLRAEDHNPVTGICTPFTRLTVTPTISGNSAPAITAGLGEPMLIELPLGFPRVGALVAACVLAAVSGCSEEPENSVLDGDRIVVAISNDSPGFALGTLNPSGFEEARHVHPGRPGQPAGGAEEGQVDLVVQTFSITQARRDEGIDFAGPYMVTSQGLGVRAGDDRIIDASSLRGRNVCVPEGTTPADVEIPGATPHPRKTDEECADAVLGGDADAMFTDTLVLHGYVHARPELKLVLPGTFGSNQYYGVGLLARHRNDCVRLNRVIQGSCRTAGAPSSSPPCPTRPRPTPGRARPKVTSRASSSRPRPTARNSPANSDRVRPAPCARPPPTGTSEVRLRGSFRRHAV